MESLQSNFYNIGGIFGILQKGGEIVMLFAPKEKGQGLVEYALILVLVAIVVIVILALLGPAIGNVFSTVIQSI
jgi:pilus assembly protein Flp/PilA